MNIFYICVETLQWIFFRFRNFYTEFRGTRRPLVNEVTNTESNSLECTLNIQSEAEDNLRVALRSRVFKRCLYPPNYYQFSSSETEFFNFHPTTYWYNYQLPTLRICKFEYYSITDKSKQTKRKIERMLTVEEACNYILGFTYYKIPVVNFIKICYQTLCKIPLSEEATLVNLIFANLKDKIPLKVQNRQLTKMTELIKLIKKAYNLPFKGSYCKYKLKAIRLKEDESIFEYIARFQQLHTMILDHKLKHNTDSNIKTIIKTLEFEHLLIFIQGIPKSILNQHLAIFPYNYIDLNFNIAEIIIRLGLIESPKKEGTKLKKSNPWQLNKYIRLYNHAPTYRRISGFILDENRIKIGMMKAKEASNIIPYFNGHVPLIYDFIKACLIAFSNTLIEEEAELVAITISRLKGEVADSVKWLITPSMLLLLQLIFAKCRVQDDKHVLLNINSLYMYPGDNIQGYVARLKHLHIILLCQCLFTNTHQSVKILIEITETISLIIFIKGLFPTSFIPNFAYKGFNDFLEKVINEYNVFQKQRMRLL